jgi:hypothetical protein
MPDFPNIEASKGIATGRNVNHVRRQSSVIQFSTF